MGTEKTRAQVDKNLRGAVDQHMRRFRELARAQWELEYSTTPDPSDACVTVQTSAHKSVPGFGFVKPSSEKATSVNGRSPRFAQ
jgi:hypothetical protein